MSSPLPPDPYVVLGVAKDAQIPEIRSAHRKLVLKCHPDKVQDPALKAIKQDEFQKVQQAYEILSDEKERSKYDEQVKLTELRKQAYAKANSSATRSSRAATAEYEVHQSAPRSSHRSSPSAAAPPPFKVYYSTKTWEDEDARRGPRIFDAEPRPSPRREGSGYVDRDSRPSKRESEREREREKERDRADRRKRADKLAREERQAKEDKEARRAEKRAREKQDAKDRKRAAEDKSRAYMTPPEEDAAPRTEKKTSSSRKHEVPRESPVERERREEYDDPRYHYAMGYINAARVGAGGAPQRSKTYHGRTPYVPSPPPAPGVASAYPSPDEDEVHRSSASRTRRGSAEVPRPTREKPYNKSSRERLDEEPVVREAAPRAAFSKSTSAAAGMSSSPPRPLPRTNTMPTENTFTRPGPGISRAQTFTEGSMPSGRGRSRMQPQADIVESEDEEEYDYERDTRRARDREREIREARERDARDRKHRSSKKHRSPERHREEPRSTNVYTFERDEEGGGPRAKLQRSYTRRLDQEPELYDQYGSGARYVDARPPLKVRESSYTGYPSTASKNFPQVRTTRMYGADDVQYTKYPASAYAA